MYIPIGDFVGGGNGAIAPPIGPMKILFKHIIVKETTAKQQILFHWNHADWIWFCFIYENIS